MKTLIEGINTRRSTRTFTGEPIGDSDCAALDKLILETKSPFGGMAHIFRRTYPDKGATKPGTYGVIKSCRDYLLLTYDSSDRAAVLAAGYMMERIVLEGTRLGLGSCWIGGTFKRSDFAKSIQIPDGEKLHAIVAIGHGCETRSLLDRLSSKIIGSSRRKPFESLFIVDGYAFKAPLEAMRLAPSARNIQPWRAFAEGTIIHFYRTEQSGYALLDCGIGLCHFHLSEKASGIDGEFFVTDAPVRKNLKYVISYSRK